MPLGLFLLVLFQESSLGFSSLHFFFFFPEAVSLEDIFSRTVGSGIQLLPELLSISAAIGAYWTQKDQRANHLHFQIRQAAAHNGTKVAAE